MKTLRELQEIWTEDFQELILNEFHEKLPPCDYNDDNRPLMVRRSVIKDGKSQFIEKCMACKKIHFVDSYKSYYGNNGKCENCGKNVMIMDTDAKNVFPSYHSYEQLRASSIFNRSGDENYYCFVHKIDDESYSITILCRKWHSTITEDDLYVKDGHNDWLDKPFVSSDMIVGQMFFSKKSGIKIYSRSRGDLLRSTDTSNEYISRNIPYTTIIDNEDKNSLISLIETITGKTDDSFTDVLFGYNNFLNENRTKRAKKKEEDYSAIIPVLKKEFVIKRMRDTIQEDLIGGIIDVSGDAAYYSLLCYCGNVIEGSDKAKLSSLSSYMTVKVKTTCPCCGRDIDQILYSSSIFGKSLSLSLWEKIEYDKVILRTFSLGISFDIKNKKEKIGEIKDDEVFLFTPEKMVYLKSKNNKWEKTNVSSISQNSYYRSNYDCLTTKEEMTEIIENSFLKTTGLLQAFGLGDFSAYKVESYTDDFNRSSYIYQWYKKPYLELVVKANLRQITKELILSEIKQTYLDASNIYDMFNITKTILKITRLRNLSLRDMDLLKRCYEYQSNFSLEQWDGLVETHLNISALLETCEKTESTIPRLLEYLQSCYDNQCIEKHQALSIYSDYYRMAKTIGFNLHDNSIKYPNSLKKEHDKATFAYKVVENEIKKKAFVEHSTENKKYEYSKGDFVVIVPMNPDEVIREGQLQKHCVASYVKRIEEGTTCICFIRKKDDIDTPYYTCEIFDRKLFQVKGYCNKYPKKSEDKELIEFLESWAKNKNLEVEYMRH